MGAWCQIWCQLSSNLSFSVNSVLDFSSTFFLFIAFYTFSLALTFNLVGEAGNGHGSMTKRDVVPYDGSKSHIATYNFCYLCKERLDTYHDDVDENWYFLDTK